MLWKKHISAVPAMQGFSAVDSLLRTVHWNVQQDLKDQTDWNHNRQHSADKLIAKASQIQEDTKQCCKANGGRQVRLLVNQIQEGRIKAIASMIMTG